MKTGNAKKKRKEKVELNAAQWPEYSYLFVLCRRFDGIIGVSFRAGV